MLQQQFIDIIRSPQQIAPANLAELELMVNEYPFFETAHLLYTKGLHQANAVNYSKQLRKTAIVANSRTVLYELIHQKQAEPKPAAIPVKEPVEIPVKEEVKPVVPEQKAPEEKEIPQKISPVTVTSDDIKVIYVNMVTEKPVVVEKQLVVEKPVMPEKELVPVVEDAKQELDIVKDIENETVAPVQEFSEEKLNKDIDSEIRRGVIQSYVETEVLKTPELNKEESTEPVSFADWLIKIKKEAGTIQRVEPEKETSARPVVEKKAVEKPKTEKKPSFFEQNKGIIDKIIEADPGRIKLGSNKFFTPAVDAKQSLLENEHLVTETLAKIYALQGNISKAIRAYEILSLKFPQKSVYFASLIEKLKTNK